jgi:flagellin
MALRIMTNEVALGAQRNLNATEERLSHTIQKMSSGSRIVKSSDDAAGLAISESINATVRSLGQATRNAQDGISLIQVFEGGTNEVNNLLMRVRELAMQAASDTVGETERGLINLEAQETLKEVDRIARTTKYAGQNLLASDDEVSLEFQVGVNNDEIVDRITFAPGDSNLTADRLGVEGINVGEKADAQEALDTIDGAINRVNEVRARVGAAQNRLYSTINSQGIFAENLSAAKSRIRDADMAEESAKLARESILRQAGVAVLAQANQTPSLALQLLNQRY